VTLAAGSRLGPYEILSPLGAGGMGEVYKARDTRLERTVAVKVLPSHMSASTEVRQRFEREAKTISQLSHPHICALYDVGREGETEYLVMEYLEGETLSERLAKGPLPLEQTLRYGVEIADALDKAHRQVIVHRDLKPGNVMLTKSGVKLLDFGLAKAMAPATEKSSLTSLPTQQNLTQEGTILGTFQYMAPEQLEGKDADARTDIFALAAVLYEMATGKKAFSGASQASLITAIMSSEPPSISAFQPMTPPALDRVVRTCLAKDPEDRWQSAHDVASELKWIGEGSQAGAPAVVVSRRKNRERLAWSAAAMLALAAILASIGYVRRAPQALEPVRFEIFPPAKGVFNNLDAPVTVSPDGRQVVFGVRDETGRSFLWIRSLGSLESRRLEETEDGYDPTWSPDGRSIAFVNSGKLLRIPASGGPVQAICDMSDGRGQSWNRENVILLTTNGGASPILRVPASGGTPVPVTALDKSRGETGHWRPRFLPDGRHFLFLIRSTQPQRSGMAIGSLDSKEIVHLPGIDIAASWSQPGLVLFVRDRTLLAQPLDMSRLRLSGDPFPVAKDVDYAQTWGAAAFSSSDNGVLTYQSGGRAIRRLMWFDRSGKELGALGDPGEYRQDPHISPDGRRVVAMRTDPESRSADLWIFDVARGVSSRLTFAPSLEEYPVWSPDGGSVVYDSNPDGVGDIYRRSAAGTGSDELLLKSPDWKSPQDWSRDGRWVAYEVANPKTRIDLWLLPMSGDKKPVPLLVTPFSEREARFSPDGKWFAYTSDESGKRDVYVQPFPPTGAKWQISVGGGTTPRWRGDGQELLYVAPDYMRKSVVIKTEPAFEAGVPKDLFKTPNSWGSDVSPDGQRFLVNMPAGDNPPSPITVVLNWTRELQKK
jgi:Tol biopolymer transport system component